MSDMVRAGVGRGERPARKWEVPTGRATSPRSESSGPLSGRELLTMAGAVKLFAIENPHSRIVVETRNAKGETETWTVETVPASRAAQLNHPLQSVALKPGDRVTVMGWPAKDGSKRLGGHKLILPDKREIMLRPAINLPAKRE